MAKRRTPVFEKLSNLIKISIFLARMRFFYLKKSAKLGKLKALKHYNSYGYIQEYEFSPSSTPLFRFHRKTPFKKPNGGLLYAMCFRGCSCFSGHGAVDENCLFESMEALPAAAAIEMERECLELSDSCCEEESVDERAEKFIERFYEEIKRQRRESSSANLPLMLEY